jgi:DNA-binding CsgD family transcriptional regulator
VETPPDPSIRDLTDRQYEVLEHICRTGDTYLATARALGVSYSTIQRHMWMIHARLRVTNTMQACRLYWEERT